MVYRNLSAVAANVVAICCTAALCRADTAVEWQPLDPTLVQTPQTLLSLFHAPEVLQELNISDIHFESIRPALQEIDGPWWRARIRSVDEQRAITARQETLLTELIRSKFGDGPVSRLRQLELQAQGPRGLIRPEVIRFLNLTSSQLRELNELFATTDELAAKAATRTAAENTDVISALKKAREKEIQRARSLMTREQHRRLFELAGKPFEAGSLQRIYPLAPELIDSGEWVGSKVQLAELRGRVVLLHFYAFQCSNCIANYAIYNRWHRDLADRGVVVIGIQTPETGKERVFDNIAQAASKDGFEFPVLADLKSENWNAWGNTMWPTVYVIDKRGFVRLWWQGELNWKGATGDRQIEDLVTELLNED